jgi:chromosome segregation ATPase
MTEPEIKAHLLAADTTVSQNRKELASAESEHESARSELSNCLREIEPLRIECERIKVLYNSARQARDQAGTKYARIAGEISAAKLRVDRARLALRESEITLRGTKQAFDEFRKFNPGEEA